jgi:hypothetical protein
MDSSDGAVRSELVDAAIGGAPAGRADIPGWLSGVDAAEGMVPRTGGIVVGHVVRCLPCGAARPIRRGRVVARIAFGCALQPLSVRHRMRSDAQRHECRLAGCHVGEPSMRSLEEKS